jgi:hypothetical protein
LRTQSGLGFRFFSSFCEIVSATAVRLGQRVSGNSNLLPGMSRLTDEHRIGYFGDWAESGCRGPSILITAFLADAQELLKVTGQPHTTGRTNDLVSAPLR